MPLVRYCKIVLILSVAFFGALGIFNFVGWEGSYRAVEAVTSMSAVPGGADAFQATDNVVVVTLGLLFIALSKLAGVGFCALGALRMWQQRNASAEDFNQAKTYALVGCSVILFMLIGGFLFLSGSFFRAWQTEIGTLASQMAFQFAGGIGLILIFVNQPDR